ncbi:hypothetical protein E4U42_000267 [Claviceps africana]|uniref:Cyclic nucleotide-binding domain-containing protein n=1 Tax=Claviceps africana TaxID=83212 RepID=A0A8K0NHY0_9HYPO|nr:hypothetical protein E4U42_000267 [Claviceps africana]
MRRARSHSSASPFRALAHHQQAASPSAWSDPSSVIRSFDVDSNPARPVRPSPLTASTIQDMPLDLVERVRSFPLFQSAPEDFLVAIGNHLKPQINGPNDHIITEGDDAKAMYWLVRGVVAVTSRDGEAVYAELKPGAFFGEIGVLMNMPRTATIIARAKCLLLVLKKEDLQLIIPNFPDMEKAIREEAQERLQLLKKQRQERGGVGLRCSKSDSASRTTVPGEVSTGESGAIKDGAVVNTKKRKSPSPGIIEDPAAGSAIGSAFVNIRKTLKELPLFSNLPPEILHFLGLSVRPKTYHPFVDMISQGNSGNEIYLIVRGEAEVIHDEPKETCHTQPTVTSVQSRPRLKAGQYFGEVSSLGLSPGRTATVRSITTVECLVVAGEVMEELWRKCPPGLRYQVEETARLRLKVQDEEEEDNNDNTTLTTTTTINNSAELDSKQDHPAARSDGVSAPSTPSKAGLTNMAFTTPSSGQGSPSQDDYEVMEHKDPDPFLSVNMENLRNRRRHSLAPPIALTSEGAAAAAGRTNGHRASLVEPGDPIVQCNANDPSSECGPPAKRARTAKSRSSFAPIPALNDETLVLVFKHLDIKELLRLRLVSRHWRHLLTHSPKVCNDVDLSHYNRFVTDHSLTRILAPFIGRRARSIDLNNCFHVTDEGFSVLWRLCGQNIKTWRMRSVWDVSAHQILEMSEHAKQLEEIDWSNCRKVGDNLLGRVVGWVVPEPPPVLKSTVMTSSAQRKSDEARKKVHGAISNPPPGTVIGCPKLSKLDLSYCKHITDRSMAHLAAHASGRLRSLSLTRCTSITDMGFQSWAQYRFEKLTHLCLADCTYLSDNAVVALVNAAKNLTHLDLSFCCALSDTSTEVVALGLPFLRELRMAFCGSAVSDASLESIALHLNELEGLSVRGCVRVTGKGLENILRGCSRLEWTDVSQCRNLEPWIRAGNVAKWGFDDRGSKPTMPTGLWTAGTDTFGEIPRPKAMSVAMLTTPRFLSQSGFGFLNKRAREPIRFIIEKGVQGLR